MWYSKLPPLDLLHPVGTVGDLRRVKTPKKHLQGPKRQHRRNLHLPERSWHPKTLEVRRDSDEAPASGRGRSNGGEQMPQPSLDVKMKVTTAMPPIIQQPERTMEPAEGPLELGVGGRIGTRTLPRSPRAATWSNRPSATTSRRSQLSHSKN